MIGGALDRANDRVTKAAQLVNYCARNEQRIVQEMKSSIYGYLLEAEEVFGSYILEEDLERIISNLNRDSDGWYVDCRKYRFCLTC